MAFEKLTDRARGFLQAAQTIAVREHHQRIAPAHLLKALLDDEQGMAAGLIDAAGGDAKAAKREVDILVGKIPTVTGSGRGLPGAGASRRCSDSWPAAAAATCGPGHAPRVHRRARDHYRPAAGCSGGKDTGTRPTALGLKP